MPKFHENFLLSRLKLRQLRLLTAIADEGTVLKGSPALNIAQPAATKSIKELEDALGVQLFERHFAEFVFVFGRSYSQRRTFCR